MKITSSSLSELVTDLSILVEYEEIANMFNDLIDHSSCLYMRFCFVFAIQVQYLYASQSAVDKVHSLYEG